MKDFTQDVSPYLRNGILIDTSVFKEIVDGTVKTRFEKKESSELKMILEFLDLIKMNNKWSKFVVTPHILTEICKHLHNDHSHHNEYKKIVDLIVPMLSEMREDDVQKERILKYIDFNSPVIEIGDISIFIVADDFVSKKEKVAILSKDDGFNAKYQYNQDVMVMDYRFNIINSY
ncbi:MAG: hypothetical protein AAB553_01200 [Patescibacteria group bacterium]